MSSGDDPTRFFFVHVQKAAGTSLFARLRRVFSSGQVYPDDSDVAHANAVAFDERHRHLPRLGPTLLVSLLLERYRVRHDEIRLVAGHFPLRTTELLGDEFRTVTVLRHPVERTLSMLRHQRDRNVADRERALEEIYEDPVRFHGLIHNHMVKMFSLTPAEILAGDGVMARIDEFTPARLDDAKQRLAAVDVIGLADDLETLCHELTAAFEWDLGQAVHANRTRPMPVSEAFRRRIEADNAADVELYEYALELTQRRRPLAT
jgi:hypothetical protein